MKLKLIYPRWPKLQYQTEFHLPPHGPVVFAATLPENVEVTFVDENVETLKTDDRPDLVALSTMLTCQLLRAFEIAREYRERNIPVLFGGIATMLHSEEVQQHATSVFLGEAEGRMEQVLADFEAGKLKPVYNFMHQPPAIESIGPARRDILKRELYNYRGVQMLDLVHASRGCKFDCFPCCTGFLGGKKFRPRPVEKFIEELETIPNNRLFIVDNSLAQDKEWLRELFTAMIPLKRKWVSHPLLDDDEILDLAAEAGCWYVYQAIFDTSDVIRRRIQRLKDRGIGVEGTIILGTDDQSEDDIKRLVDFLMEIGLDVAEFTILTPFMQSPIRAKLEREGRILSNDWLRYTADQVVFQPKQMSPDRLQELYSYAWETFYAGSGHQLKMGELFKKVMEKEMADGTYRRYDPRQPRSFKKKES
ncbi:MAG: radical SAM protein [Geothermobacteraceae bacterium]